MGDVCGLESAVTRQLHHAILQLCNEHVNYEHTLQVLGVICVTVDDQPRDVVVKLNNTLKRVDAVTPVTDDRRLGTVRTSASTLWPRPAATSCGSSTAAGSSSTVYTGDVLPGPRETTTACTEATPVTSASGSSRKCHGRKQSNPVKVETVVDDDENYMSDVCASGVLLIAPAEPSATDDEQGVITSPSSSPRVGRSVDEDLGQRGRRHADTPTPGGSGSATRGPLMTGVVGDDVIHRRLGFSSSVVEDSRLRRDCASSDVQPAALNFSRRTSDRAASPDCVAGGSTDLKIKEEVPPASLPLTPYGLDLGVGRSGTFDMSRSMSVAAAAAAFSQYMDDPALLQSLTSYDQQRLALYSSLVSAAAASGVPPAACDNGPSPSMSLLNGAGLDSADLPSSKLDHSLAVSSYAMSGRLRDDITMHGHLPAVRRRERFGCGPHHTHQPPMKVSHVAQRSFTQL